TGSRGALTGAGIDLFAGVFRLPDDRDAPGCRVIVRGPRPDQPDALMRGNALELGWRRRAHAAGAELGVTSRVAGQQLVVGYILGEGHDRELIVARLVLAAGADGLAGRIAQAPATVA